jgi:seryl-tRNA synthetase
MLYIPFIRENRALVVSGLLKKGVSSPDALIDVILRLDDQKRRLQRQAEDARARINLHNTKIAEFMRTNQLALAETLKEDNKLLKDEIRVCGEQLDPLQEELTNALLRLPNPAAEEVPEGRDSTGNEVVRTVGEIPTGDGLHPHWVLSERYRLIDFELGNKIAGRGFPVYRDRASKLQRALISFFLEQAEQAGYSEVQVPVLVNEASVYATGQLPDKDAQMYRVTEDNLYLIPTAEVPITNLYRDVMVPTAELPVRLVGYTPSFRREAGSWGADVRGLNRLHQFDKVEIVQITEPESSDATLHEMVAYVEGLLQKLGLPYRVLRLCGGDMSFTSAITYDFEVYSAGQGKWLEVSSVSNFGTYQANRLKLRSKAGLLHTLNGSALALPRVMSAILENYQTTEGIDVPECLRKYLSFDVIN